MTECKALLLTDVVDSTKLMEQLGDKAMAEAWAAHDRAARDLLSRWRGREFGKTDGMLLLFDSAADAVNYAHDYHRALRDLRVPLRARAGLHVGPVVLRRNSTDDIAHGAKPLEVDGIAVPIVARIMSVASGGQTLLSPQAREALAKSPLRIESHGHWRMKGVAEPVELFEVGDDASPWQPPPDAAKVYRVVPDGDLWKPLKEIRHNLPRERDTFVGRESDLAALARLVDEGAAIVTLLGTGGSGKTRLARRFGWTWLGDFPGGVWFCDLSFARSLDGLASAVATALDVPLGKGDSVVQLGHAIAGRERCLVILDNFEQVAALAEATVGQWVDRAREAVFLVTSRERLRLPGEQIFAVEPLPETPAMALFEARARAQDRSFALGEGNRADVATIVRTLDGIPLAIELAVARIRVLPPKQLRERLRERFRILAGARGFAERHATLLAAIDWSWDLLAPWEKSTLAQCSAFAGGFTLAAAEAVLDLSAFPEAPLVLDAVQALVDKSLLRAEAGRRDIEEPFFGMYVSIHEYAAQKLHAPGAFEGSGGVGEQSVWERHGSYYARFGTEQAIDALDRHGGVEKRRRLALDLENLVAACRRAVARGDEESATATLGAAWAVFALGGPYASAAALAREAFACAGLSTAARARMLACLGEACWMAGRMEEAREQSERALAGAREVGDRHFEGIVLVNLANLHHSQGRMDEAQDHYERALAIHREVGNRRWEGIVLGGQGLLHRNQGLVDKAQEHLERALAIHREVGNRRFEGQVLGNLAIVHQSQGRMDEAREQYERALAIHREVGDRRSEGHVVGNLGELHHAQGRMEEARAYLEQALAIDRSVGDRLAEGVVLGNLGSLHLHQGQMPEAREQYERALVIHREVGNRRSEGIVLANLGRLHQAQGRTEDAWEHYESALAIHRAVGNRRSEGVMLGNLGELHMEQGRLRDAREQLEQALAIHRAVGNFNFEGIELGRLGSVHARAGESAEARAAFAAGEQRLREVGDELELGALVCARGEMEADVGDMTAARACLSEARALAANVAAGPGSALGRAVAKLHERLAGKANGLHEGLGGIVGLSA